MLSKPQDKMSEVSARVDRSSNDSVYKNSESLLKREVELCEAALQWSGYWPEEGYISQPCCSIGAPQSTTLRFYSRKEKMSFWKFEKWKKKFPTSLCHFPWCTFPLEHHSHGCSLVAKQEKFPLPILIIIQESIIQDLKHMSSHPMI